MSEHYELNRLRAQVALRDERIAELEALITFHICKPCYSAVNLPGRGPKCKGCEIYAVMEAEP